MNSNVDIYIQIELTTATAAASTNAGGTATLKVFVFSKKVFDIRSGLLLYAVGTCGSSAYLKPKNERKNKLFDTSSISYVSIN